MRWESQLPACEHWSELQFRKRKLRVILVIFFSATLKVDEFYKTGSRVQNVFTRINFSFSTLGNFGNGVEWIFKRRILLVPWP